MGTVVDTPGRKICENDSDFTKYFPPTAQMLGTNDDFSEIRVYHKAFSTY
jgi:hypothetical protein